MNGSIDAVCMKVRQYAEGRAGDVARGAETARLAAVLLDKYGTGACDAVIALLDALRAADPVRAVTDELVSRLDPQWRETNQARWASRPADLALTEATR